MTAQTHTCTKCQKQFLIIDQEQKFLTEKNLPLPTMCPSCRQTRRLMIRGGERALYKTTCQQCGKEIVTSYDPKNVPGKILCKEDYEKYFAENEVIITDSLPDV